MIIFTTGLSTVILATYQELCNVGLCILYKLKSFLGIVVKGLCLNSIKLKYSIRNITKTVTELQAGNMISDQKIAYVHLDGRLVRDEFVHKF